MKRCPTCNTTYGDEQNFCLNDGQTLVSDAPAAYGGTGMPTENINYGSGNAPTQVMYATPTAQPQPPPAVQSQPYTPPVARRRSPLPWIIVGVLVIAGIVVTILLLTRGSGGSSGSTTADDGKPLSTPTKAYQTFYYAMKNKDPKALRSVMPKELVDQGEQNAKAQNKTLEQLIQQNFDQGGMPKVPSSLPDSRNEKVSGNTATLEVNDPDKGTWETLYFLKEGDEWKIDFRKMMS